MTYNKFDQPGIDHFIPGYEDSPLGVKVTGRNIGAVALLVSTSAEGFGHKAGFSAHFNPDGSLVEVYVADEMAKASLAAGSYLILSPDRKTLHPVNSEGEYNKMKEDFVAMAKMFETITRLLGVEL